MPRIPRDSNLDATLAVMRDPYGYIGKRCRQYGTDLFTTRLLWQPTICLTGPAAAQLFYDNQRFTRAGAAPGRIQKTLFGQGGVQGLDGQQHRHRKALFMSLMGADRVAALAELTRHWGRVYAERWASADTVALYPEFQQLLTCAVCQWAGVPLPDSDVEARTRQITALFDDAGSVGPKHWWARLARKSADRWAQQVIDDVRAGRLDPPEDTAAQTIAWHRGHHGALLTPRVAAVELLNVLRPTVAVAVYATFVAHALHQHPQCRDALKTGGDGYAQQFVQEVRRFYPFFPSVMAVVRDDFDWNGYPFPAGRRVVLDLYGTNHDPRTWDAPHQFRPDRFRTWDDNPHTFIPQGGGDPHTDHRCPGERIAVELMKTTANLLTRDISYDVPAQDLRMDTSTLPALPRSRMQISNVLPVR